MKEPMEEYERALRLRRLRAEDLAPSRLERHLPLLERLDAVEDSSVVVYDLFEQKYVFLTSSFKFLLGYRREEALEQGPACFYRQMHPKDLPVVLDSVSRTLRFLCGLPAERRRDFKLAFDFRIRRADGPYIRLLPAGSLSSLATRQLRGLKAGELYLFASEKQEGGGPPRLTRREIEILGLAAVGLASKEIADRLLISTATVNNHRQRILEKMQARNSSEAVRYAARLGIL